jgi:hypothetical protein
MTVDSLNLLEVLWSEYFLNCGSPLLIIICSDSLHLAMIIHHIFDYKLEGLVVFCERNVQPASVNIIQI